MTQNPDNPQAHITGEEMRAAAAYKLLELPDSEKLKRFDAMVKATFSHIDGRDLLKELHPRRMLDIKRRVDGKEIWFQGDWLTTLMNARDKRAL